MHASGILKPVYHAAQWIHRFVIVNNKQLDKHSKPHLPICLHPSNLNQAIAREPFYYRLPDDIFQKLSKTKSLQ